MPYLQETGDFSLKVLKASVPLRWRVKCTPLRCPRKPGVCKPWYLALSCSLPSRLAVLGGRHGGPGAVFVRAVQGGQVLRGQLLLPAERRPLE